VKNFDMVKFNEAMEIVKEWDFSLAIKKLQEPSYGSWSESRALQAVEDYKRYLSITKTLNGYQLVPNGDLDEVWHLHLLDTRRYVDDCYSLFGGFLHHYPYYGMIDQENKQDWLDNQEFSSDLWNKLFSETLYSESSEAMKCPQACPCKRGEELIPNIDTNYRIAI